MNSENGMEMGNENIREKENSPEDDGNGFDAASGSHTVEMEHSDFLSRLIGRNITVKIPDHVTGGPGAKVLDIEAEPVGPFEVSKPCLPVIPFGKEFPWGVYTLGNTPAHDAGSDLLFCLTLERSLLCGYVELMRQGMEPFPSAEVLLELAIKDS
jgi:hypothetical protein